MRRRRLALIVLVVLEACEPSGSCNLAVGIEIAQDAWARKSVAPKKPVTNNRSWPEVRAHPRAAQQSLQSRRLGAWSGVAGPLLCQISVCAEISRASST
jgi:hypothetical protein